jgi:hypothetical protein
MARCRPGTRVVLSYNQPAAVLTGSTAQIAAAFAGLAAEMGEPFISRFLPGEIARLQRERGFGQITDFGPDEARAASFRGRPTSKSPELSGWLPPPWPRLRGFGVRGPSPPEAAEPVERETVGGQGYRARSVPI